MSRKLNVEIMNSNTAIFVWDEDKLWAKKEYANVNAVLTRMMVDNQRLSSWGHLS